MITASSRSIAFVMVLFAAGAASAQEQEVGRLITGLGGEAGFGAGVLEGNDDGSSAEIDLSGAFPEGLPFFGQTFRSMYVNNNGSITFGGATGTFTPVRFPLQGNRMIAPFWADVDTRQQGRPARNGVYWDIRPGRVVVTWHRVGFFPLNDSRQNTFQLVLISNQALREDHLWRVEFRYDTLEWTTGGASGGNGGFGGVPAQAGFDAGDGTTFRILPGSGTRSVLQLARTSNIGDPGIWLINIFDGVPQAVTSDREQRRRPR
jgi:hypothetical protein